MQVDKLMHQMNLTGIVKASNIDSNSNLTTALNITCSLLYAETDLIPNISDGTLLIPVVKQLNNATIKDSCLWLQEVVSTQRGGVACDRGSAYLDATICKRWNSIQHFRATNVHVKNLLMLLPTTS